MWISPPHFLSIQSELKYEMRWDQTSEVGWCFADVHHSHARSTIVIHVWCWTTADNDFWTSCPTVHSLMTNYKNSVFLTGQNSFDDLFQLGGLEFMRVEPDLHPAVTSYTVWDLWSNTEVDILWSAGHFWPFHPPCSARVTSIVIWNVNKRYLRRACKTTVVLLVWKGAFLFKWTRVCQQLV